MVETALRPRDAKRTSSLRLAVMTAVQVALVIATAGCDSCRPIAGAGDPARPQSAPDAQADAADPAIEGLSAPKGRPPTFRRGVALGLFVNESDPAARRFYYEQFLDEIVAVGATDVSLVVRWSQRDVEATQVGPVSGVTVDDAVLLEVVGMARARGLRVFLLPTLHLRRMRRGQWRGALEPKDWDEWFTSYEAFVVHYATLAQSSGVDLFSVGSELVSAERHAERWRAVIAAVRAVFRGRLTYSANWDHFEPVSFWDALDVVGVTAYPELSDDDDPDAAALERGWGPFRARLRSWAARNGHQYIFTEVGFPAHADAARRPWDYTARGPADVQLQLRCFRSLYQVWQADPRLDGIYVWNWFGVGGPDDTGYTPRGKPSETLLRHWFRGSVAVPGPAD